MRCWAESPSANGSRAVKQREIPDTVHLGGPQVRLDDVYSDLVIRGYDDRTNKPGLCITAVAALLTLEGPAISLKDFFEFPPISRRDSLHGGARSKPTGLRPCGRTVPRPSLLR